MNGEEHSKSFVFRFPEPRQDIFGDSEPLADTPLLSTRDTGTNLLEVFEPYTTGIMTLVCNELPVSIFMPARQI